MISKLPKWVELGALVLAVVAGYVNSVGLLGFDHQSVSHLTGTATLLGTSLLAISAQNTLHLLGVIIAFILGSSVSGFLLHGATLRLGRHYDTALFIEAALLFISFGFLVKGSFYGHFFASAACGLQNALATTYSGAVIRTTHLTGIFTDLGIMLGEFFRGQKVDRRKAELFCIIIVGFIIGATLGALVFKTYHYFALLLPAVICFVIAMVYRLYATAQR